MSSRAARGAPVRGYRRRKTVLDLDLNTAPPSDSRDLEGTSTQVEHNGIQGRSALPAMIDVEAIDDDVVESSPRAFAQVCFFCFFFLNLLIYGLMFLQLIASTMFYLMLGQKQFQKEWWKGCCGCGSR